FFFQAEDGIRVFHVTGVQTCALPISAADKIAFGNTLPSVQGTFGSNLFYKGFELGLMFDYQFGGQLYNQTLVDRVENIDPRFNRSEERRVGKECREWRAPMR